MIYTHYSNSAILHDHLGVLLASTLVMKLIDACRERISSRKSNLHFLVANDETYALAA